MTPATNPLRAATSETRAAVAGISRSSVVPIPTKPQDRGDLKNRNNYQASDQERPAGHPGTADGQCQKQPGNNDIND